MSLSSVVAVFIHVIGWHVEVGVVQFKDYNSCYRWLDQYGEHNPYFETFCMDKKLFDKLNTKYLDTSKS